MDRPATSVNLGEPLCLTTSQHPGIISDTFNCSLCSFTTPSQYEFSVHSRAHSAQCYFTCKICEFSVDERPLMVAHLKVHQNTVLSSGKDIGVNFELYVHVPSEKTTKHVEDYSPHKTHFDSFSFGDELHVSAPQSSGDVSSLSTPSAEHYLPDAHTSMDSEPLYDRCSNVTPIRPFCSDQKSKPVAIVHGSRASDVGGSQHDRRPLVMPTLRDEEREERNDDVDCSPIQHRDNANSNEYGCHYCPYVSKNAYQLKVHEQCHTVINKFSCCECGYSESELWQVRKHLLLHGRSAKIIRNPVYVGGASPPQQNTSPSRDGTEHERLPPPDSKQFPDIDKSCYHNEEPTGDDSDPGDGMMKHPPSKAALKYYDTGSKSSQFRTSMALMTSDNVSDIDASEPCRTMSPIPAEVQPRTTIPVLDSLSPSSTNNLVFCQNKPIEDQKCSEPEYSPTQFLGKSIHSSNSSLDRNSANSSGIEITNSYNYSPKPLDNLTQKSSRELSPADEQFNVSVANRSKPVVLSPAQTELNISHTQSFEQNVDYQLDGHSQPLNNCRQHYSHSSGSPNRLISTTNSYMSNQIPMDSYRTKQQPHSPIHQSHVSTSINSPSNSQPSPNPTHHNTSPRHGGLQTSPRRNSHHVSEYVQHSPADIHSPSNISYPSTPAASVHQTLSTPEQNYEKLTESYAPNLDNSFRHKKNNEQFHSHSKGSHPDYFGHDRESRDHLPFSTESNPYISSIENTQQSILDHFNNSLLGSVDSHIGSTASGSRGGYNYLSSDLVSSPYSRSYDLGRGSLDYPSSTHGVTGGFSSYSNAGSLMPYITGPSSTNFNNVYNTSLGMNTSYPGALGFPPAPHMNYDNPHSSRTINSYGGHNLNFEQVSSYNRQTSNIAHGSFSNVENSDIGNQRNSLDNPWPIVDANSSSDIAMPSLGPQANSHLMSMESMTQSVPPLEEGFNESAIEPNRWSLELDPPRLLKETPLPDFSVQPPPQEHTSISNELDSNYKKIIDDNWPPIHHTSTIESTLPFAAQQNSLNQALEQQPREESAIHTDQKSLESNNMEEFSSPDSCDPNRHPEQYPPHDSECNKRKSYRRNMSPKRCSYCPFVTHGNLRHLEIHERCHRIQSKFTCNKCGYSVPHNSNLWAHRQLHRTDDDTSQQIPYGSENEPSLKISSNIPQDDLPESPDTQKLEHFEKSPNTVNESFKEDISDALVKRRGRQAGSRLTVAQKRSALVVNRTECKYCPFKASKPCANGYYLHLHERHHFMGCKFTCDICRYSAPHLITVKKHKMLHILEKEAGINKVYLFPDSEAIPYKIRHRGEKVIKQILSVNVEPESHSPQLDVDVISAQEGGDDELRQREHPVGTITSTMDAIDTHTSAILNRISKEEKDSVVHPDVVVKRKKIFSSKRNMSLSSVALFLANMKAKGSGRRGRPRKTLPAGVTESASQKSRIMLPDHETLWECKYCPFVTSGVHASHNLGCHHKCHEQPSNYHCDQCTFSSPTSAGIDKHKLFHNPDHRVSVISKIMTQNMHHDPFGPDSSKFLMENKTYVKFSKTSTDNVKSAARSQKIKSQSTRSLPSRDAKIKAKPIIDDEEKYDVDIDPSGLRKNKFRKSVQEIRPSDAEKSEHNTLNEANKGRMSDCKEASDTVFEWQKAVYASPHSDKHVAWSNDGNEKIPQIDTMDSCEGDVVTERPNADHKWQHDSETIYNLSPKSSKHYSGSDKTEQLDTELSPALPLTEMDKSIDVYSKSLQSLIDNDSQTDIDTPEDTGNTLSTVLEVKCIKHSDNVDIGKNTYEHDILAKDTTKLHVMKDKAKFLDSEVSPTKTDVKSYQLENGLPTNKKTSSINLIQTVDSSYNNKKSTKNIDYVTITSKDTSNVASDRQSKKKYVKRRPTKKESLSHDEDDIITQLGKNKITWRQLSLLHNKALIDSAREVEIYFLSKLKGKIGNQVIACNHCSFVSYGENSSIEMKTHEACHKAKHVHACHVCSFGTKNKDTLLTHNYFIHQQPIQLWMRLIKFISSEELTSLLMIYATLPIHEKNDVHNSSENNECAGVDSIEKICIDDEATKKEEENITKAHPRVPDRKLPVKEITKCKMKRIGVKDIPKKTVREINRTRSSSNITDILKHKKHPSVRLRTRVHRKSISKEVSFNESSTVEHAVNIESKSVKSQRNNLLNKNSVTEISLEDHIDQMPSVETNLDTEKKARLVDVVSFEIETADVSKKDSGTKITIPAQEISEGSIFKSAPKTLHISNGCNSTPASNVNYFSSAERENGNDKHRISDTTLQLCDDKLKNKSIDQREIRTLRKKRIPSISPGTSESNNVVTTTRNRHTRTTKSRDAHVGCRLIRNNCESMNNPEILTDLTANRLKHIVNQSGTESKGQSLCKTKSLQIEIRKDNKKTFNDKCSVEAMPSGDHTSTKKSGYNDHRSYFNITHTGSILADEKVTYDAEKYNAQPNKPFPDSIGISAIDECGITPPNENNVDAITKPRIGVYKKRTIKSKKGNRTCNRFKNAISESEMAVLRKNEPNGDGIDKLNLSEVDRLNDHVADAMFQTSTCKRNMRNNMISGPVLINKEATNCDANSTSVGRDTGETNDHSAFYQNKTVNEAVGNSVVKSFSSGVNLKKCKLPHSKTGNVKKKRSLINETKYGDTSDTEAYSDKKLYSEIKTAEKEELTTEQTHSPKTIQYKGRKTTRSLKIFKRGSNNARIVEKSRKRKLSPITQKIKKAMTTSAQNIKMAQTQCLYCPYKSTEVSVQKHQQAHVRESRFKCNQCSFGSNVIHHVTKHQRLHKDTNNIDVEQETVTCSIFVPNADMVPKETKHNDTIDGSTKTLDNVMLTSPVDQSNNSV